MLQLNRQLFVCSICHAHFTRKCSAERHVKNLHEDTACSSPEVPVKRSKQDDSLDNRLPKENCIEGACDTVQCLETEETTQVKTD